MSIFSGFAAVNDTKLYYEVAGSGYPVVFIHGFSLDTRMWDAQYHIFAERYRVIRYDMRGYGKSELPSDESHSHAGDLKALLDVLGIKKAHIIGFSMGGGTAVEFAISHPEYCLSLTAVDALVSGYDWQSQELGKSFRSVITKAQTENVQVAKELWLAQPLFASAHQKPDVKPLLHEIVADYSGWHFVNSNFGRPLDPPVTQQLDRITAPTQIFVGSDDLPELQEVADLLWQGISGADKIILQGAGHLSNMENYAEFNEVVLGFLSKI